MADDYTVPPDSPRRAGQPASPRRSDRSPWYWLLLVPIVVPLLTSLYNYDTPRFAGLPMFYWMQFAFIILGVAVTTLVYQMTKRRG